MGGSPKVPVKPLQSDVRPKNLPQNGHDMPPENSCLLCQKGPMYGGFHMGLPYGGLHMGLPKPSPEEPPPRPGEGSARPVSPETGPSPPTPPGASEQWLGILNPHVVGTRRRPGEGYKGRHQAEPLIKK